MDIRKIGKNIGSGITKFFLGNSVSLSSFLGGIARGAWTRGDLAEQYSRYVFSIIRARSEEAAKIDFKTYKIGKDGKKENIERHPFLDLMTRPNPNQSQFQFLEFYFTDMDIFGEAFWYIARGERSKMPKELYRLNPANVDVALSKDEDGNQVVGYVLHKADGKDVPLEASEVLHVKTPNPTNPARGKSIIEAGKDYIQTEGYASDWTKNAIYNAGRPSGILNIKGKISKEEFDRVKRRFKESYSGTKNAGKTMLIKAAEGLDYQKLGMELQEVALKEMKDMTRDDIMFMFRMSKTLMGISDDVNRSNAREAKAVFIENIIVPMLDRLVDHINAFFIEDFNSRAAKYYDTEEKYFKAGSQAINDVLVGYKDPRIIDDAEKLEQWKEGYNKWLSTNDIRAEKGLEPVDGGDVIYIPFNLVPMGGSVNTDNSKGVQVNDKENKEINTKGMNESEFVQTITKEAKDKKKPKKKRKEKVLAHKIAVGNKEIVINDEVAEGFRKTIFEGEKAWELKIQEAVVAEFKRQEEEILSRNTKAKGYKKKELTSWIFDKAKANAEFLLTLAPLLVELMKDLSKEAFKLAGNDSGVLDIDVQLMQIVNGRIQRFADKTNDDTIKNIEDTITEGLANNETISELKERIQSVYKEATDVRAIRIARTESLFATCESSEEAYRQSGVPKKRWFAEPTACEFCKEKHGKIIGIDENFATVGETITVGEHSLPIDYSDITHPPLHPNCECAILPVIDKR
jgi:HK97 family phage portal protein